MNSTDQAENKIKKELANPDHITADSFIDIASNMDNLSHETNKTYVSYISDFNNVASNAISSIRLQCEHVITANAENYKDLIASINVSLSTLNEILRDKDLSSDERVSVMHEISSLHKLAKEANSEQVKTNIKLVGIGAGVVTAAAITVANLAKAIIDNKHKP